MKIQRNCSYAALIILNVIFIFAIVIFLSTNRCPIDNSKSLLNSTQYSTTEQTTDQAENLSKNIVSDTLLKSKSGWNLFADSDNMYFIAVPDQWSTDKLVRSDGEVAYTLYLNGKKNAQDANYANISMFHSPKFAIDQSAVVVGSDISNELLGTINISGYTAKVTKETSITPNQYLVRIFFDKGDTTYTFMYSINIQNPDLELMKLTCQKIIQTFHFVEVTD